MSTLDMLDKAFPLSSSPSTPLPASSSAPPAPTLASLPHPAFLHRPTDPLASGRASPLGQQLLSARPTEARSPPVASSSVARGPTPSHGALNLSPRTANQLRPPVNVPPYAVPANLDVLYPANAKPNPFAGSMDVQPTFGAEHPPGSLYRPELMPPDLDERLDKRSIWMTLEERTNKANYLSPPPCDICRAPNIAQHCDRGYPSCGRCRQKGLHCEFRDAQWTNVRSRPKKKRKTSSAQPHASNEVVELSPYKGKERAGLDDGEDESVDGAPVQQVKPKKRPHPPPPPLPLAEHRLLPSYNPATSGGRRLLSSAERSTPPPIWANSWAAYVEANPLIRNSWSAHADISPFLRSLQLLPTDGGLVGQDNGLYTLALPTDDDLDGEPNGENRLAEAVVLSGAHYGQGAYCSSEGRDGTLVVSLGKKRLRRKITSSESTEEPAVSALLKAHRSHTPVAVVLARDYEGFDFAVPKLYELWGYFWIVASWVEPDVPGLTFFVEDQAKQADFPLVVRWKFRFQYCSSQGPPWWHSDSIDPGPPPSVETFHTDSKIRGSPTVRPTLEDHQVDGRYDYVCKHCKMLSERVYLQGDLCLNEKCRWYFGDVSGVRGEDYIGAHSNEPGPLAPTFRFPPEINGKPVLPLPESSSHLHRGREDLFQMMWAGWVCSGCHMANERMHWKDSVCQNCQKPAVRASNGAEWALAQLRDPERPVATSARKDEGNPSFPIETFRSSTYFVDHTRVVDYGVKQTEDDAQMLLALHANVASIDEGRNLDNIFARLLAEPPDLVRYLLPLGEGEKEQSRSPYFSYACGAEDVSAACGIPTKFDRSDLGSRGAVPEVLRLMTHQCARFWPGESILNSFVILAVPPGLPQDKTLRFNVEPETYAAILWLGSDGALKIRTYNHASPAELGDVHSGDVFGIHTGNEAVELRPSTRVFGFICIGQYVEETRSRAKTPKSKPPPKVIKPEFAPLTEWYIGSRPLDPTQPLRPAPAMRVKPTPPATNGIPPATDADESVEWTGVEVLASAPTSPKELVPPPYTIPELSAELQAKRSAATTSRKGALKEAKEGKVAQGGKGRKRKSAVGVNAEDVAIDVDEQSNTGVKLEEASSVASGPASGGKKARKSDVSTSGAAGKKKVRKSAGGGS